MKIDGEKVIVTSPEGKVPISARYARKDHPKVNLVNVSGLPASLFRIDAFFESPHLIRHRTRKKAFTRLNRMGIEKKAFADRKGEI